MQTNKPPRVRLDFFYPSSDVDQWKHLIEVFYIEHIAIFPWSFAPTPLGAIVCLTRGGYARPTKKHRKYLHATLKLWFARFTPKPIDFKACVVLELADASLSTQICRPSRGVASSAFSMAELPSRSGSLQSSSSDPAKEGWSEQSPPCQWRTAS